MGGGCSFFLAGGQGGFLGLEREQAVQFWKKVAEQGLQQMPKPMVGGSELGMFWKVLDPDGCREGSGVPEEVRR